MAAKKPAAAAPKVESPAIAAVRRVLLGADARVAEEVKWNSPSFHVGGAHFATVNVRGPAGAILLILHRGAKKRPDPLDPKAIPDPRGLLEWLGPDRAAVRLADAKAVKERAADIAAVVRHWIRHV